MVQIEMSETSAKKIEALKGSGYDELLTEIAARLVQDLTISGGSVEVGSERYNQLQAANWLFDYADLIKGLSAKD